MDNNQENRNVGAPLDVKKTPDGKKHYGLLLLLAGIILCAVMALLVFQQKKAGDTENLTLRVSLFPIVPDMEGYKNAVVSSWEAEHPDTKIEFVDWYCYGEDFPDDLDVFVFDGIFLS